MILPLKNGKLIPPRDPVAGRKAAFMVAAECTRIQAQLDGPLPDTVTRGGRDYKEWRASAERALTMHNLALRLLSEWLEDQGAGMLRRAVKLLNTLVDEGCDFTKEEIDFVKELNTLIYDSKQDNQQGESK